MLTHCRNWSVIWLVPLLYSVVAGLEGLLAGSIVGLVCVFRILCEACVFPSLFAWFTDDLMNRLGAVYEAGNFRMSTFLPMIWGGVNVMVLIVTSFPMQGGL